MDMSVNVRVCKYPMFEIPCKIIEFACMVLNFNAAAMMHLFFLVVEAGSLTNQNTLIKNSHVFSSCEFGESGK